MREIKKVHLHIELILGVILITYSMLFTIDNIKLLVGFICQGISTIFSVASFLVVYYNFRKNIDNRAKIIGICGIIISLCINIQGIYETRMWMQYEVIVIQKILCSILVLVSVMICTDENRHSLSTKIKTILVTSIVILTGEVLSIWLRINTSLKLLFMVIQLFVFGVSISLVMMRCAKLRKKLNLSSLRDDTRFCMNICIGSILVWITMIFEVFVDWYILTIIKLIVNIAIYINIFKYIRTNVLMSHNGKCTEIKEHNSKDNNKSYFAQNMLFSAALQMNSKINNMNNMVRAMCSKSNIAAGSKELLYISKMQKNCNILEKLSGNIMNLNNNIHEEYNIHFEKIDIITFVQDSIDSLIPYFNSKNIRLEYDISDRYLECEFGTQELERILINVVSNSIKYTKPGGVVVVTINRDSIKNRVEIQIKDSGIGIKGEDLKNIFVRFSRYSNKGEKREEGSGLGLTIVKNLVELHNGKVEISSTIGIGTTVSINLPLTQS